MPSDHISEIYDELHGELLDVEMKFENDITIEDYKAIHDKFTQFLMTLDASDKQKSICIIERGMQELEEDFQKLNIDCADLQLTATHRYEAVTSCIESVLMSNSQQFTPYDARVFQAVSTQVAELQAQLIIAKTVFKALLSKTTEDIIEGRFPRIDIRYAQADIWETKESQLTHLFDNLRFKASTKGIPIDTEETMMAEVQRLARQTIKHVEHSLQQEKKRDDQLISFNKECTNLIVWTRKQISNLEVMQEPEHIQFFCATLAESYKIMWNNFALLVQKVYPYVRLNHQPVRQALEEAAGLWYYLLVFALERLSKTLLEIHPRSPLDIQVDKYATYPHDIMTFLDMLSEALGNVIIEKNKLSHDAAELRASCDEARAAIGSYQPLLVERIQQFAIRARAMRSAYASLREALLTRLTFLSSTTDIVISSKRRQHEFQECVRELKSWATNQAHGESWRDIYSKIVEIKRMIECESANIEARKDTAVVP